jgi:hypothetical protein
MILLDHEVQYHIILLINVILLAMVRTSDSIKDSQHETKSDHRPSYCFTTGQQRKQARSRFSQFPPPGFPVPYNPAQLQEHVQTCSAVLTYSERVVKIPSSYTARDAYVLCLQPFFLKGKRLAWTRDTRTLYICAAFAINGYAMTLSHACCELVCLWLEWTSSHQCISWGWGRSSHFGDEVKTHLPSPKLLILFNLFFALKFFPPSHIPPPYLPPSYFPPHSIAKAQEPH